MDAGRLLERLAAGEIVDLPHAQWEDLAASFEVIEQHDTRMRGMLLVVESSAGLAVVEEPSPALRVVRPLPTLHDVHCFVAERLAAYDRMWDGCGCRIDYSH